MACTEGLIKGEEIICTRCIYELPRTNYHLNPDNPIFKRLFGRLPVKSAFAFLLFKKGGRVQNLLHELKYNNHPEVGRIVGKVYGQELLENGLNEQIDSIFPIPLHPAKQRRRGYNQSEEFAKGLAESLSVKCNAHAVVRTTVTETQTKKSKLRRWENVKEVFRVQDQNAVHGKRILLVDDVITTGATIEACGQVLIDAGCTSLHIAGLAYAAE